jgi:hypothetical protein
MPASFGSPQRKTPSNTLLDYSSPPPKSPSYSSPRRDQFLGTPPSVLKMGKTATYRSMPVPHSEGKFMNKNRFRGKCCGCVVGGGLGLGAERSPQLKKHPPQ